MYIPYKLSFYFIFFFYLISHALLLILYLLLSQNLFFHRHTMESSFPYSLFSTFHFLFSFYIFNITNSLFTNFDVLLYWIGNLSIVFFSTLELNNNISLSFLIFFYFIKTFTSFICICYLVFFTFYAFNFILIQYRRRYLNILFWVQYFQVSHYFLAFILLTLSVLFIVLSYK